MKNKVIKLIVAAIVAIGLTGLISTPTYATYNNICDTDASPEIKAASGCPGTTSPTDIKDATTGILNGIIGILAIVAVVVIIIGGVQYMVSTGDSAKTKKAKDTILYACIGLIICALAAVIVNFVIVNLINNNSDGGGSGEDPEFIEEPIDANPHHQNP
jgi:amino acid transporter